MVIVFPFLFYGVFSSDFVPEDVTHLAAGSLSRQSIFSSKPTTLPTRFPFSIVVWFLPAFCNGAINLRISGDVLMMVLRPVGFIFVLSHDVFEGCPIHLFPSLFRFFFVFCL